MVSCLCCGSHSPSAVYPDVRRPCHNGCTSNHIPMMTFKASGKIGTYTAGWGATGSVVIGQGRTRDVRRLQQVLLDR
jgi:hypothetical protein